ncbi:hypothetical protein MtrunA17_Chr7g0261481 [Medicago truncatula]|nr:hypothetical protein MtrunA17_Chr7g0261481 [Medicago truncatula]
MVLPSVAEAHSAEGMHLPTLNFYLFHMYPCVFCTLNLLIYIFLHQLPKTQTTLTSLIYTFQLLSKLLPKLSSLNLESPSSSTTTTLIHSGGRTTTKLRRTTAHPIPSSLS